MSVRKCVKEPVNRAEGSSSGRALVLARHLSGRHLFGGLFRRSLSGAGRLSGQLYDHMSAAWPAQLGPIGRAFNRLGPYHASSPRNRAYSLGANWSRICLSRTLNHGALWHIDFLRLRNILTYLLTYLLLPELAVSSVAMTVAIASSHCAYPSRDGQAELTWAVD